MVSFEEIIAAATGSVSSIGNIISQSPDSQSILISIGIVIIISAILAIILKLLKQEIIPAYILAGLIIGPLVLGLVKDTSVISALAEIGIAFLLFVAGIEISFKKLKETSTGSLVAGFFQIIIIGVATFFISTALGFGRIESFYLALALSFSSTILVIKLFADKYELNTLHARIAISILLIQDIVAIFALAILSGRFTHIFVYLALLKVFLLLLIAFFLSKTILKPLFNFASRSTELLFIVSIALVFLFSALSHILGLSIIIGAFIGGLSLANLRYKTEIVSKIRPLRDFFAIIFFVSLGMLLTTFNFRELIVPLVVLLAIVLIAKPFITAFFIRIAGYGQRTSALTGFGLAQISEFSLILILQGFVLGIVTQKTFSLVVLVAMITMALTPYLIRGSLTFYSRSIGAIKIIEKLPTGKEKTRYKFQKKKTLLLVGAHRMGSVFIKKLERLKHRILVVDFNPEIIKALERKNISAIYGDIANTEIFNHLPLAKLKVVISTVPNKEDNILVIRYFKKLLPKVFVTVTAQRIDDALEMYKLGADYVISPMIVSAEHAIENIIKLNKWQFRKLKKKQIRYLRDLNKTL
ncbi:MAG: cation:proton antiporter [Candidatus Pacearchaeota archaeon]|nr:MAG: cation:proton antiporter [Candidatus Pacearchaeota archaeon]